MFSVQKLAPYNFKNFHAVKIEHILRIAARLVREVAAVGEAVPSLTDAGGYLFNGKWKIIFEKFNNTLSCPSDTLPMGNRQKGRGWHVLIERL